MNTIARGLAVAVLTLTLAACTSSYDAPRVRLAQIDQHAGALQRGEPLWVVFEPGDELPLYVSVRGALVETSGEPLTLRVKRRFFVLLGDGMPRISFDGVHVADLPPGSFHIGLGKSKELGEHVQVGVVIGAHTAGQSVPQEAAGGQPSLSRSEPQSHDMQN
jgi:hypothetical protein